MYGVGYLLYLYNTTDIVLTDLKYEMWCSCVHWKVQICLHLKLVVPQKIWQFHVLWSKISKQLIRLLCTLFWLSETEEIAECLCTNEIFACMSHRSSVWVNLVKMAWRQMAPIVIYIQSAVRKLTTVLSRYAKCCLCSCIWHFVQFSTTLSCSTFLLYYSVDM